MITIIGLGPAALDQLSMRAWEILRRTETLYLRSSQHPGLPDLPSHITLRSFDEVYEAFDQFDDVYAEIAERVLRTAQREGQVVYAVPGDPLVGEASVSRIRERAAAAGIQVEIVHGISFIEPCLALLGLDALDGLQIHDALTVAEQYHPPLNPALPALLAQVYSRSVASALKLTLMNQYADDFPVKLIHGAGSDAARVESLKLYEIDRSSHIDAMTTLYLPPIDPLSSFEALQNIIAHLRSPEGCPWDRQQTHQSLRPFLLEETYEALEALDDDNAEALVEELGDLLLQVLLHTQIAIEAGEFSMAELLQRLNEKMIRRHPHVWGDVETDGDLRQLSRIWQEVKDAEKAETASEDKSLLDGVPRAAPALLVAHQYSHRAAKVGFDWHDISGVESKFQEELAEVFAAGTDAARAEEIGDLIFVLVNWLRWLNVDDPESLLREVNAKFYRRFRHVEREAARRGKALADCSLDEMEDFWQAGKRFGL